MFLGSTVFEKNPILTCENFMHACFYFCAVSQRASLYGCSACVYRRAYSNRDGQY